MFCINYYKAGKKRVNHLKKLLELFPSAPWDYNALSRNPNLSWEIVRDKPDKPWNWSRISYNSNTITLGQRYYLRVKKVGSTLSAEIYTNAARTLLFQTISRTINTSAFNYLYVFIFKRSLTQGRGSISLD